MGTFIRKMHESIKSRKGQSMVEYGLIIGLVALVLAAALGMLHQPITQIFAAVSAALGANP